MGKLQMDENLVHQLNLQVEIKENLLQKNQILLDLKKHLNLQTECIKRENKRNNSLRIVSFIFLE